MRQAQMTQFAPLAGLFRKLEIVRMPLAKHEVPSTPGYRNTSYYPTSVWHTDNGWVGWDVFNPDSKKNEVFMRTNLANEFLEAAI